MKIRLKISLLILLIIGLSLCFYSVKANSFTHPPSIEDIRDIPLSDVYLLGRSDCQLDALERQYYAFLLTAGKTPIAVHLYHALEAKREEIIFLRSRTDSLVFDLAFKDTLEKEKHIKYCVQYNRFYKPAVQYQLEKIASDSLRSLACLHYLGEVYKNLGSDSLLASLCSKVYETILKTASKDNEKGLFGDALSMMEKIQVILPLYEVPSRNFRRSNKEESILRKAHQGIYTSYYRVAEKAYMQKKERLAEKYAHSALAYYQDKEIYMNGVNPAKTLLKQITHKYEQNIKYAQGGEALVLKERIENLKKITGDTLSQTPLLSMHLDILPRKKIEMQDTADFRLSNSFHFAEKEVEDENLAQLPIKEKAMMAQSSPKRPKKYDSRMAIRYKDFIYDGRLLMSIRRFEEAQNLFQQALALETDYRLNLDKELRDLLKENTYFYIEQVLNNAQYFVWIQREEKIKEEENKAKQIYKVYQTDFQEFSSAEIEFLFEDYQNSKAQILCRKADEKRQNYTSLAKYEGMMGRYRKAYDYMDSARQLGITNPCLSEDSMIENLYQEYAFIKSHYDNLELSEAKLNQGDTTSYINIYLMLSKNYQQHPFKNINLRWVDLCDKLVYEKNYAILLFWLHKEFSAANCNKSLYLYNLLEEKGVDKLGDYKKRMKYSKKLLKKCF